MRVMLTEELSYSFYIVRAGWLSGNVVDSYLITGWLESRPRHRYPEGFFIAFLGPSRQTPG
jgi:hypothetical protein